MNVSLTPTLEKFVKQKVSSGLYNSASEVIRESLRLFDEKDKMKEFKLKELRHDIRKGIDSAKTGELISSEDVFDKLITRHNKKYRND